MFGFMCVVSVTKFSSSQLVANGMITVMMIFFDIFSPEMSAMMQKAQAAAIAAAAAATASQQQASPKPGSHGNSSDKFSQLCVYCNQVRFYC